MDGTTSKLSVSAAARLLNVSPSTVQRLCNRNLLAYETTQGGHRRIAQSELSALLKQLRGKSAELLISRPAAHLTTHEIAQLLLSGCDQRLLDWFKAGQPDPQALVEKIEGQLHTAIIELDTMFVNGQLATHNMWLAMNTARTVVEQLSAHIGATKNARGPKAIGGSMMGFGRELGVPLVELGLRLCGHHAIGLKTAVSPKGLAAAAAYLKADLVWVSHTHIVSAFDTVEWHRQLAELLPPTVRVLIGGGALSPSIRRQLPPHTYYESIAALIVGENRTPTPSNSTLIGPHFAPSHPSAAHVYAI